MVFKFANTDTERNPTNKRIHVYPVTFNAKTGFVNRIRNIDIKKMKGKKAITSLPPIALGYLRNIDPFPKPYR